MLHVPTQEHALCKAAEAAEGRRESHAIHHPGPGLGRLEEVLVRNDANGPRTCSSTNRPGRSHSVILLVICHGTPKCRARHVTSSLRPSRPLRMPPIACSPDRAMELVCASTSEDRSNAASGATASWVTHSKLTDTASILTGTRLVEERHLWPFLGCGWFDCLGLVIVGRTR